MWNRRHRWPRRFAAGLAFAALAVPTAQAGIAEDSGMGAESNVASQHSGYEADSSGIGGSSGQSSAEYNGSGYQQSPGVPLRKSGIARVTDSGYVLKDGMWVKATATYVVRPGDRGERITPSGGGLPLIVAAEPATGFDWGDAGIGAGVGVGLMLLALGAVLATRHASRKTLAGA
jgi:hypothetical protein